MEKTVKSYVFQFQFIILCLLIVLCSAIPATAGVIFTDTFDTVASPLWDEAHGTWEVSGGVYDAPNGGNTYLPFILQDFEISVDMNNITDGGIWARATPNYIGSTNCFINACGVMLITGGQGGGGQGLYFHVTTPTGWWTQGSSGNIGLHGANETIRLVVSGNTYSAYVGNSTTAAISITENTYTSGQTGLYVLENTQTFDNVVVSAVVPEPISSTLFIVGGATLGLRRFRKKRDVA